MSTRASFFSSFVFRLGLLLCFCFGPVASQMRFDRYTPMLMESSSDRWITQNNPSVLQGDNIFANFSLPFSLTLGNTTDITMLYVDVNGRVSTVPISIGSKSYNYTDAVSACWNDWATDFGGNDTGVYYSIEGVSPNRRAVISWVVRYSGWSGTPSVFQMQLAESTSFIRMVFNNTNVGLLNGYNCISGVGDLGGSLVYDHVLQWGVWGDQYQYEIVGMLASGPMPGSPEWMNCPSDIAAGTQFNVNGSYVWWNPPRVWAYQYISNVTATKKPGDLFPVGRTLVEYTAVSWNATTHCRFNVTVTDVTPPVVTGCPENRTLTTAQPYPNHVWAEVQQAQVWDAVDGDLSNAPFEYESDPIGWNNGLSWWLYVGNYSWYYRFTDSSNNTAMCNWSITVRDGIPPTWTTLPKNFIRNTTNPNGTVVVTWRYPTATDNIGVVRINHTHVNGTAFPVGKTTVTHVAVDAENNELVGRFNVTVNYVP